MEDLREESLSGKAYILGIKVYVLFCRTIETPNLSVNPIAIVLVIVLLMESLFPHPFIDQRQEFFLKHGYRFVRSIREHPFIGLFSLVTRREQPVLVVIKADFNVDREHDAIVRLLSLAPTAPVTRIAGPIIRDQAPYESFYHGLSYLVMNYIPGVPLITLASLKQRDPVVVRRFITMLHKITDLLATTGLHHGDLNFGNILTNDDLETFVLIDFEYAEVHDNPRRRAYAVWVDIVDMVKQLYGPKSSRPQAIRSYIAELRDRDFNEEMTSFELSEDVNACRCLIDLVKQDLLG